MDIDIDIQMYIYYVQTGSSPVVLRRRCLFARRAPSRSAADAQPAAARSGVNPIQCIQREMHIKILHNIIFTCSAAAEVAGACAARTVAICRRCSACIRSLWARSAASRSICMLNRRLCNSSSAWKGEEIHNNHWHQHHKE